MEDPAVGKALDYRISAAHADAEAEAILEGSTAKDPSLEQVREILFGVESRRAEAARRALESKFTERLGRLEAEYERRFEKLLLDLQQRYDKACELVTAEAAERRKSMQTQHDELMARLEHAAASLGQSKTSREELAVLLDDVATRLRAAANG
jgi:uncharacterized protein YicC (UPF0701 family)